MDVVADPTRGHVALVREGETVVTFTDLGTVLQVWQMGSGVELNSTAAAELGEALTLWATRKARAEDGERWDAAYAQRDQDDPPGRCNECGERRTVYCNGDGFGYCRDHYPTGAL